MSYGLNIEMHKQVIILPYNAFFFNDARYMYLI